MATFDEKEMLNDEMFSSVVSVMRRKLPLDDEPGEEWQSDFKLLHAFRNELLHKTPENIDYSAAVAFYQSIIDKYVKLPDAW